MLILKRSELEKFVKLNSRMIIKHMVKYIPEVVVDEMDGINDFMARVLKASSKMGVFRNEFVSNTPGQSLTEGDVDALARFILVGIGARGVELRGPISIQHVQITPDGDFKPVDTPIEQVMISWVMSTDTTLDCVVSYPELDPDVAQSWTIE